MPGFVAAELIVWLSEHKIIRPGHTTLQELVSEALSTERRRLGGLLAEVLDESAKAALGQLLVRDDTLSQLAALQDAKDFGWRQMAGEREKRATLKSLHGIAALLPKLGISQQNLHYASLANFYTVHDLRHLKAEQTRLYLLCYAWVRYRQLTDNLVDAMAFHMKNLRTRAARVRNSPLSPNSCDAIRKRRRLAAAVAVRGRQRGRSDAVRRGAPTRLQNHVQGIAAKHGAAHERQATEQTGAALAGGGRPGRTHSTPSTAAVRRARLRRHGPDNPWLAALTWAKSVFAKQQRLSQRPLNVRRQRCRNACVRTC